MKITRGLVEGQVLQRVGKRGASVTLLGECGETAPLFATLFSKRKAVKGWSKKRIAASARGKFKAHLSGIPSGGPYQMKLVCGDESAQIKAFYVGDVWLMAGQSNMQGLANMAGAATPHPLVRAFSMRREWRLATDPLHVLAESPDACNNKRENGQSCPVIDGERIRRNVKKGTGVGIFFAREMLRRTGVPQGLICAAHGGTAMVHWHPDHTLKAANSLYVSMLESVQATGQPISGMLWYQGESDADPQHAPLYTERMQKLVSAVRKDLHQPHLPWLMVQIARSISPELPSSWNSIQEQQRLLPHKTSKLEVISAIDLPLDDHIHIGTEGFPRLAIRLARIAAREAHRDLKEKRPPQIKKITLLPNRPCMECVVEIEFDSVVGGLRSTGEPHGFQCVDTEGRLLSAVYKTTLHGNRVRVYLIPEARHTEWKIGYGLGLNPICNITDARDCSLSAFSPMEIKIPQAFFPYVTTWNATSLLPLQALEKITLADLKRAQYSVKTYANSDFINEHANWNNKPGVAFFSMRIKLPEAMKLDFLMGYDAPFRLWLNGNPFYIDMAGNNPGYPDRGKKPADLKAGEHDIRIAMDTNGGLGWGFYLRFKRRDVSLKKIRSGQYVKPTYLT
ncbi:MAG: sialate O-acetylesterase [Chthoniobacterales bacterium]